MDKLKNLLLPLALLFGAIAIFETGARYGATNLRAHALARELQLPLSIYLSSQSTMDEQIGAQWEMVIDNCIAVSAVHRQIWYLQKEAKATLDKALTVALSVRGEETANYFDSFTNSDPPHGLTSMKLNEIRNAIEIATTELIHSAPNLKKAALSQANNSDRDSTGP
jgi:hypothetical protein